ncbi:MAG TPA: FliM/FliN family flagellar motor switch protein, partial [Longimicrobiales bacterium]
RSRRAPSSDIQVYDFHRPNLISKDRLRTLEAMYGLLVKSVEGWLVGRTRGHVELELLGVEHFSFGEFVLSLPNPSASYVYDLVGSGGRQAVIDVGRDFAFFLVERLLGGGGPPILQDRALTPLERMLVRLVADHIASALGEVWADHIPMELTLNRFESLPEMIQIANPEDPVLVGNIKVNAAGVASVVLLCLPFTVLEKFFIGSGSKRLLQLGGTEEERERDREHAANSLRSARLPVAVRLPAFLSPLQTLAGLRPGSQLATTLPTQVRAEVMVAGQPRFRGAIGGFNGRYALRVTELVGADPDTGPTLPQTRIDFMSTAENTAFQAELEASPMEEGQGLALSALYGLSLPIAIELGRTSMSVQEILGLGRGSVIQLERLVGEPVDVFVGDRRFAEGEVVVLGEQFAVRITRIVAPTALVEAR